MDGPIGTGRGWHARLSGGLLAGVVIAALAVSFVPRPERAALGQDATPPGGATPLATERDAELADLQTRVAVLATEVARLGGADPAAVAGRLGGNRSGFDALYGRPVAYPAPDAVAYDVPDVGRVTATFQDDRASRIVVSPPRPADKPLEEADAADWSLDTARELVARFGPTDAAFAGQETVEGKPQLVIPGTSEGLTAAAVPADASGCAAAGASPFQATLTTPTADTVSAIELAFDRSAPAATLPVTNPDQPRTGRVAGNTQANSSLGGTVNVNGIRAQATQVRPNAAGTRQPAAGQSFWAVRLTIDNQSNAPLDYDLVDFALVDGRGREIPAVCGGVEPAITKGELQPGETADGWVTFQVPEGFDPERFAFIVSGARIGFQIPSR